MVLDYTLPGSGERKQHRVLGKVAMGTAVRRAADVVVLDCALDVVHSRQGRGSSVGG